MQKRLQTLLIILLTAISASLSAAPVGYSVNSDSGSDLSDGLYTIDLQTGLALDRIGTVQSTLLQRRIDVEGLAFAPDGTLYGIDDDSLKLFAISQVNALVDPEKDYDLSGLSNGKNDFGMTFACDENLYVTSVTDQSLYRVGPEGDMELVGGPGTGKLGEKISALAAYGFPVQLYGLGNGIVGVGAPPTPKLYLIDTVTGTVSNEWALNGAFGDYGSGGLAFDDAGDLWAMTDRRQDDRPSQVMMIDKTNGAVSGVQDVATNTPEEALGFQSLAIASPGGCTSSGNGQIATFFVQKRFADGNDTTPVTLHFQCNGGTVFNGTKTYYPTGDDYGIYQTSFSVDNVPDAPISCQVWEDTPPGYTPEYSCESETSCTTAEGAGPCTFDGIAAGQEDLCLIVDQVTPVEVDVHKVWEMIGSVQADVDQDVRIYLECDAEIVGGSSSGGGSGATWYANEYLSLSGGDFDDEDDEYTGMGTATFSVIPEFYTTAADPEDQHFTTCRAWEDVNDGYVEIDNGCEDSEGDGTLMVAAGMGDECTITNTVFFEGIPALNHYGIILFAALMMLTGMVAVRRLG